MTLPARRPEPLPHGVRPRRLPVTPSGVARAAACPASCALPLAPPPESPEANRGTSVHAYLAALAMGRDPAAALEGVGAAHVAFCQSIDLGRLPLALAPAGTVGSPELALALDLATGECRPLPHAPTREERYFQATERELPGTLDLLLVRPGGAPPLLVDYKVTPYSFDPADAEPQLRAGAAMVARYLGVEAVETQCCVIGESGSVGYGDATLYGPEAIRETFRWLRWVARRAWTQRRAREAHEARSPAPWTPDVAEGPHCRHCDAMVYCPAKHAAFAMVLGAAGRPVDPATAGRAYLAVQTAEHAAATMRETLRGFVGAYGPQPTGDGREVRLDGRGSLGVRKVRA